MADLNKFEEMLERLINEDKAGAEELFHEIVVEKSRDIYESLLEDEEVDESDDEDDNDEEVDESTDDEVEESDDEDLDEGFDLEEFEVEADPMVAFGGDMADDLEGDVDDMAPDMDADSEEGEGDAGETNDGTASVAIGQIAHRAGAEDEEDDGGDGDLGDRAVGDAERLPDVGTEDADGGALEFVHRVEREQYEEREGTALGEAGLE